MAFYTRTIEIEGVAYKQIGPTQWQNLKTGQIIDNTKLVVLVNEFKQRRAISALVGGTAGACCEIVDGVMECSSKTQDACSEGCFKGEGTDCGESPTPCSTCVHCCFVGAGCLARTPSACLLAGGTYFAFDQGCTACKFGVCSSDTTTTQRFYGNGCTGTFVVGGATNSFDLGVFCTGSGIGQTCGSTGFRYQQLTPTFIEGATCSACILGACCTGGTCLGGTLASQAACSAVAGLFYPGQTCGRCDFGVYCTGDGVNRTCLRTGYRGEALTNQFQQGATCSYCTMGTCCVNGDATVGVRQTNCAGTFFPGIFNLNACDTGSCCLGATCNENVFRYDCAGVFNDGMTCIACSDGACCLPGGGCTLTSMGTCMATGGTFFGGATCSACDNGACCNNGQCTEQRRGNICPGNFYAGANCSPETPCLIGACCLGATCISGTENANCDNLGGYFIGGFTCIGCLTGANCLTDLEENGDRSCLPNAYFGDVIDGSFYQNQGCSACQAGVCCNLLGGGTSAIRGDCTGSSTFYAGQTLFICDAGVYCTGSGVGQTCFGLGHRGQSLTNNFIAGATCNACILGACCTGGTCLSGGLTSQAACSSAGGLFFAGRTCTVCDYGVYCTGATCLSLGYRGQSLSNNFIVGATCSSCILGACCTGGTCSGGGQTSQAACSGLFYPGATCRACDYGVYCTGATCFEFGYRAQALTNNFIQGATCSSCILGACCTGGTCLGGGQTSQAACSIAGGTFYVGATCFQCDMGVYCTGSGVGQTCFGLGHRGQSLTNNFIAGRTCSSCILGACCTGGTCLGGGLTSQAACSTVGGLFYAGTTCVSCDYGVYCTGSNETTSCLGLGYRAQNLSNQFIISGNCVSDCTYGSCCDGITCLGITSQANCNKPYSFFVGMTCGACDTGTGACCTGGSSSITTITGCNALGGIFFPEGTTALCVTGSCCTGGTCTQEIVGRSGNCQLFIAGATCSICDTGVYCTGATCFQLGFRGQSLTNNFIVGATCNSCILGICCTGGTCIGGGQTAQIYCPSSVGSFVVGATQCSACANNVNCCVDGVHSYVLAETCLGQGGIVFEGSEDSLVCESGAFCIGITCAGVTLNGYDLTDSFIVDGDCGDCIMGNCCLDEVHTYVTQNECSRLSGIFYPGEEDLNICGQEEIYGLCCQGETCSSGVEQNDCSGYFISNSVAQANNISCDTNPCQIGVCCKETVITSVTGGTCAGIMTRAECSLTGGDFFPSSEGYTCSNCLYIPMLASALFERVAGDLQSTAARRTLTYPFAEIGVTGAEIQPVDPSKTGADTWLQSSSNLYGAGATTIVADFNRDKSTFGSSTVHFRFASPNFSIFRPWYNSGVTMNNASLQGLTNGSFDVPPSGLTSDNSGRTLGYIMGANLADVYDVARYIRFVFDYAKSGGTWSGKSIVVRYMGSTGIGTRSVQYSLNDATKHAGLTVGQFNVFPSPNPLFETTGTPYSSGVLAQVFAENPLKYRIRPVGACCKGITCLGIVTQDQCTFTGGTFYGDQGCWACDRTKVLGNCCTGGTYHGYTNEVACLAIGGYFSRSTTVNTNVCIYGTECVNETCVAPNIYFGQYIGGSGRTFVSFSYAENLGCSACDRGICCVGLTCNGYIPRITCAGLSGTFYENESVCGEVCNIGVCCELGSTGCGTFTNSVNCRGINQYFFSGYTAGQTCSACSSLFTLQANASGVSYAYTFNKGTTYGTFFDGSIWVQETNDLRLLDVRTVYDDAQATRFDKISAGKDHTVALTRFSGFVLGYGSNEYGQAGFTQESFRKTYNVFGEGFKDVAAGFYHTLAVSNGGTVSAWGRNDTGQCNVPSGLTGVRLVSAGEFHSVALREDGGITCWGDNSFNQLNIPAGLSGVTFIASGARHTLALKTDGTVVAWGDNTQGQCNIPAGLSGVSQISAGYYHNLAIFGASAGITGWGRNNEGQLNINTTRTPFLAVAGGGNFTIVKHTRNTTEEVVGYGSNSHGQITIRNIIDATNTLYAGENSAFAMESGGLAYSWGSTAFGKTTLKNLSEYKANTKITNLDLTPSGYKGTIYIHGIDKNPMPRTYLDLNTGYTFNKQKFTSIGYDNYNVGWITSFVPLATENPDNYPSFDLNTFEEYRAKLRSGGITLAGGDVVLCNTGNFSIYSKTFPKNAGGYPYQLQGERANTLTYGIINCLSATGASLAGSTLCFRPPVSWPQEDRTNKPIYRVSSMEGRIPGQAGNTLIVATNNDTSYNTLQTYMQSYAQTSEFGDGVDYGVVTPMWAMNGYGVSESSYGEQYMYKLNELIISIYATGGSNNLYSLSQRRELLSRVVQYGLDSWGAQKSYCLNLSSGAGQKPSRTRPWIPLAGYYLGVTNMYKPEDTMLLDTARLNHFINYYYTSDQAQLPGRTFPPGAWHTAENNGVCSTQAQWWRYRYGDTGPENNFEGLRRAIGRVMSHEVNTSVEYINDRSNLLRHYEYVGSYYKNTQFSGFGTGGATGITFYNEFSTRTLDPIAGVTAYGNFGVVRWGSSVTAANPFTFLTLNSKGVTVTAYRFTYDTKEGYKAAWEGGWLRVEGGPGSSGPGGATASRYYRVLYTNGFRDDSTPVPNSLGGGWQMVIGQTWADGIPDHTSTLKFYPFIESDMGLTRPCFLCPEGYTFSKIGFVRVHAPQACAPNTKSVSLIYDAAVHSALPYANNSLDVWIQPYFLAEYITRTKGETLISDITNITDHLRQFIYASPYNIIGLFYYKSVINSPVIQAWAGATLNDRQLIKSNINFAQHFPGIISWYGLTV